jgi:hypothetical protein
VEIAYCTLFVFTSSFGQTFFLSLFSPHWGAALGLSAGTLGLVYGLATLAAGALLPLSGRWLDSAPSGRAGLVTFGGLTTACLVAAAVSNLWLLAAAMFLLRFFGQGMCVNVGLTRAARWFDHNRGKAVSLAVTGFPLGEAVLPIARHCSSTRWAGGGRGGGGGDQRAGAGAGGHGVAGAPAGGAWVGAGAGVRTRGDAGGVLGSGARLAVLGDAGRDGTGAVRGHGDHLFPGHDRRGRVAGTRR